MADTIYTGLLNTSVKYNNGQVADPNRAGSFDVNNQFTRNSVLYNPNLFWGLTTSRNLSSLGNQASVAAFDYLSGQLANQTNPFDVNGNSIEQGLANIYSSGLTSLGNTVFNNTIKKTSFLEGAGANLGQSVKGAATGLGANLVGQGITSLGGNSMLSRGIGQGIATGIANGISNFKTIGKSINDIKAYSKAAKALDFMKDSPEAMELAKLSNAGKWNLVGIGGQIVGQGLSAAFGPSKEYGGKYGSITQGMDTAYDVVQGAAGFFGPVGMGVSGIMALNKGLSNIFGSTSGMTKTDAILGSAFMPAPVKWLNMAGAKTTDAFKNLSWLNTEKANSFMQNAFGNLSDKFDLAREEAGKTYGTFSRGAYRDALDNLRFANDAWNKVLAMADQNELLNIRSLYMTSINNLRYAQEIGGAWLPIYRGKQGMKIFNNATNHNIGMRLLSGAALIDNKQMILCSVVD